MELKHIISIVYRPLLLNPLQNSLNTSLFDPNSTIVVDSFQRIQSDYKINVISEPYLQIL